MKIKVDNLTKKYGQLVALDNITMTFNQNKIIGLLGDNGSGKSTLIKLIANLLSPTSGNITYDGEQFNYNMLNKISYLPERSYLNISATPGYYLAYFKKFFNDFDQDLYLKLLKEHNIPLNKPIRALSKGMREKVQLFLVLARRCEIYIFDEPLAGVDQVARDFILDTIVKFRAPNSTVIITTHLIYDVDKFLDEVIFIKNGKVILYDDKDNIVNRYQKSLVDVFRELYYVFWDI